MGKKHIQSLKTWIFVLIACFILLNSAGCSQDDSSSGNKETSSNPNTEQTSTGLKPDEDKADPGHEKTKNDNGTADKTQEVECDWTLTVDDTVSTKVNGYDFKCTLNVKATKIGGKNDIGPYGGTVKLTYEYHMQSQGVTGNAAGSGQDPSTVIDVVPYDAAKYSDFGAAGGKSAPLAPLIEYDTMALGNFSLTGSGLSEEASGGANWSKQESKTIAVPYKIVIEGGQVVMELPSIAPGVKFKGILAGTPR